MTDHRMVEYQQCPGQAHKLPKPVSGWSRNNAIALSDAIGND